MHELFAVSLQSGEIEDVIRKYAHITFRKKGVPRIISTDKQYNGFVVRNGSGVRMEGKYLLVSEYVEGSVSVTLSVKTEDAFDRFVVKVGERMKRENYEKEEICSTEDDNEKKNYDVEEMCSMRDDNEKKNYEKEEMCTMEDGNGKKDSHSAADECCCTRIGEYEMVSREKKHHDDETGTKQEIENNGEVNDDDRKCDTIKRTKENGSFILDHFCISVGKINDKYVRKSRCGTEKNTEGQKERVMQQICSSPQHSNSIRSPRVEMFVQDLLPRSFEVLGKTLILNLSDDQKKYKIEIAEYFVDLGKYKTIFLKKDVVKEPYRTTEYELLLGEDSKDVLYVENGTKFAFNIGDVYFNSKLSGAREQLVNKFRKNDVVADLFCGIGPISIQALKRGCYVIANDINPKAIESFKNNLKINRITARHEVYNEDAKDVLLSLTNRVIDHFVFNLPELSIYFIKYVKAFTNSELHCYFFCRKGRDVFAYLREEIGLVVPQGCIKECRNVAPSKLYYYMGVEIKDLRWLEDGRV